MEDIPQMTPEDAPEAEDRPALAFGCVVVSSVVVIGVLLVVSQLYAFLFGHWSFG